MSRHSEVQKRNIQQDNGEEIDDPKKSHIYIVLETIYILDDHEQAQKRGLNVRKTYSGSLFLSKETTFLFLRKQTERNRYLYSKIIEYRFRSEEEEEKEVWPVGD
ncbi:hypothetical protein CDAR_311731 [Caerostris darwini]|uniref:Uncharacterized protein n=1 Tax=Caerostris darwini TaxID=1538125 RepID=A0AAV4TK07_9ARAC|nr:hypothetical protein CDAR_311731 [Caerostris darwini]